MLLPLLKRRQLDATELAEVLQFRWLAGVGTLYSGVNRVLPGTSMVLERGDDGVSLSTRQFWRFNTDPEPADRPMEEWVDEVERALAAAVAGRTAGADNVTVLLSGGVDSPVLTQQVKRHCRRYSMISPTWRGFDDPKIPRVVEYGRLIGGDHRVVVMDPDCVEEEFVRQNRRFEQPARSPHALTLARVGAELDGFDLLLHGEGADALFGADHRVSSAS
jgi:asparagine synthetase B (glutamine-hydrolysing)